MCDIEPEEAGDEEDTEIATAFMEGKLAERMRLSEEREAAEKEAAKQKAIAMQRAQEEGRRQLAMAMSKMNLTKVTLRFEPCDDPERCLGVKCAIPAKWLEKPTPCQKLIKFFVQTYAARRNFRLDPKDLKLMLTSQGQPLDSNMPIKDLLEMEGVTETIYVGVPPPPDPCAHLDKQAMELIQKFNSRSIDHSELTKQLNDIENKRKAIKGGLITEGDDDDVEQGPAIPSGGDCFDFDDDVL